MSEIIDLEYVTEWGSVGDCLLCGEPIEHGQTRATITTSHGGTAWTHDHCAEPQQNLIAGQSNV